MEKKQVFLLDGRAPTTDDGWIRAWFPTEDAAREWAEKCNEWDEDGYEITAYDLPTTPEEFCEIA